MNIINVNTKNPYEVLVSDNYEAFTDKISEKFSRNKHSFIITDKNVGRLYVKEVSSVLKKHFETLKIIELEEGENSKSLQKLSKIYQYLIENDADRTSAIIALGGGVIGDISGLAASTYMRGISLLQMPTTLLAQVDSSVGGKTAIDFMGYKNIIGTFCQPTLVCVNTKTLKTLPKAQISSGMAEVLKCGLINDTGLFNYICEYVKGRNRNNFEYKFYEKIISKSIKTKVKFVEPDEHDNGVREALNFGHTVGHAIESLKKFEMSHGECVGLGMLVALWISKNRVGSNKESLCKALDDLRNILEILNLPSNVSGLTSDEICAAMLKDKKAVDGVVKFVLLKSPGSYYSAEDISENEIKTALETIITL